MKIQGKRKVSRLVFAALPYGNGPLHFGRIGGSLLPADIFTRYLRLKGEDVVFISGTDCYGTPIMYAAEQRSVPYQSFVLEWHQRFAKTLALWHIRLDRYGLTHTTVHRVRVTDYLSRLPLEAVSQDTFYCQTCKSWKFTRYFSALCKYCRAETVSELCQNCGNHNETKDLQDPKCRHCKTRLCIRPASNYVLDMAKYETDIRAHFNKPLEKTVISGFYANSKAAKKAILRPLAWGVPSTLLKDHVIYVWFQALLGYLTMSQQYLADDSVNFIGVDNLFYHTVVYGTLRKALGLSLPSIHTRRWFLLDQHKQSSSKLNYLDLYQLSLSPLTRDLCRAYLVSKDTLHKQSNLSPSEFQSFYDLYRNKIHNLYYRTYTFALKRGVSTVKFETYRVSLDSCYDRLMLRSELAAVWDYLLSKFIRYNQVFQTHYTSWTLEELSNFVDQITGVLQLLAPLCPRYYGEWRRLLEFTQDGPLTRGLLKPPFRLANVVS